jgi:16S rRNA (cytosine967-C5)-methyltransferase
LSAERRKEIAKGILKSYTDTLPFDQYLRQVFRKNKQFGSNDRRFYRDYIYAWFRTGQWLLDQAEKWDASAFLLRLDEKYPKVFRWEKDGPRSKCQSSENRWKCLFDHREEVPGLAVIFPAFNELSERFKSNTPEWLFEQAKLWFRLSNANTILSDFATPGDFPLSYHSAERVDLQSHLSHIIYEVQDIASQKATAFVPVKNGASVWDCCAGSGGKSLFIADHYHPQLLWCSDVRKNSLRNLEKRFRNRSLKPVVSECDPISETPFNMPDFDHIIADVPCSGSGTWRRNPENLVFFDRNKIEYYQHLQRRIIKAVVQKLSPTGKLHYITCSMYQSENEENVRWFEEHLDLTCVRSDYIDERDNGGDVLFAAELHWS